MFLPFSFATMRGFCFENSFSTSNTSKAAPPRWSFIKASASASSSTTPPACNLLNTVQCISRTKEEQKEKLPRASGLERDTCISSRYLYAGARVARVAAVEKYLPTYPPSFFLPCASSDVLL